MARTAQTARDPSDEPIRWIQREYVDHEGNTVILGKVTAYASKFYLPEDGEAYRLQVYSTTPIRPEELQKLYEYFCSEVSQPPFLEIYSYNPPDGLACVEHQRRETAHRKRLQAEQRQGEYDESLPPLIPMMRTGFDDQFMSGFCFLLTSESYLLGSFPDNDHGTGPWWITFDRNLPSTPSKTFAEWGSSVNPEIRDIKVNITTDQDVMGYNMKEILRETYSAYAIGQIDYGPHEPPLTPLSEETLTSQYVQEVLEQQQQPPEVQPADLNTLHLTIGTEKDTFLANIEQEKTTLLEATARTFTAGIVSCLPVSKTFYFEFRIPGSSLSSLISAAPNGFDVGASHEFEAGSVMRIQPQIDRDVYARPLPYNYFTVVLDKPAFIQKPSVLFYTLWTDPSQYIQPQTSDSVIDTRRRAGIQEAARRLARLAVEEKINRSPGKLTKEEHRELLSLSPEEYEQKMNF
ncbi:hypothetical protein PENSUB_8550 [Penicillium subrubescens]|uniref:Uncharacterized protein n=1 Tax=Penicillium subrubescens TaxID=1316194 RepID=A0A1Q5TG02_9EURO|nr:hypothetical protein PENSUB_8550 [Penicillium subrubescens]